MFETDFSYKSSTPLPPSVSINTALRLLHDFETINRLNPDVRGQKPITPKNGLHKANGLATGCTNAFGQVQYFEVEDDLPFIPKKLWSGGVRYQADFIPLDEGCDITIHAPGGFTSVNHWRLVHESDRTVDAIPEHGEGRPLGEYQQTDVDGTALGRVKSKDLLHADEVGGKWFVQIVSDARCSRTFAGFVKGFLKNSHSQLERAFVDKLQEVSASNNGVARPMTSRRPTLGRRKSSQF
nr:hypothetical protein B0A51_06948 [Rachicladosporium sp. CCFEE 5018]